MPVLEGSTTDSGLASSGLVRTSGELVLAGAIAVPVGALVRMAYRTPLYYGAMPRPRLRVLACHQDPLRGITRLRLGCALAWKWSQAAPRATDTDLDPDDPALDIHKAASDWLTEAFAGAGLRVRSLPALSTHILKTWRWSEGYLAAAAEILETFGYLGFTGPDEVIDIISLADGGSLAGPTLDIEDILDTKPLSTSGTVGREFHSTGLSYSSGVSARSASSVASSTTTSSVTQTIRTTISGSSSGVTTLGGYTSGSGTGSGGTGGGGGSTPGDGGGTTAYPLPANLWVNPGPGAVDSGYTWKTHNALRPVGVKGSGIVTHQVVSNTRTSETSVEYDGYGRRVRKVVVVSDHSLNMNPAYAMDITRQIAHTDPDDAAPEAFREFFDVSSWIETEYRYEEVRPDLYTAVGDLMQARARARMVYSRRRKWVPELVMAGGSGIRYVFRDDEGNISVYHPGSSLMLAEEIETFNHYNAQGRRDRSTTVRTLYGSASQQGSAGAAMTKFKTAGQASSYIADLATQSRAEITVNQPAILTGATVRAGSGQPWWQPKQRQVRGRTSTSGAARSQRREASSNRRTSGSTGSRATTRTTYRAPSTVVATTDTIRVNGTSTQLPGGSAEADRAAIALFQQYGTVQHRLAEGLAHGVQLAAPLGTLPNAPGAFFHLRGVDGVLGTYRASEMTVAFVPGNVVASVEGLFWGASA